MGRVAFKQCDVERAARALKAVGETVKGVEIRPDGSWRVLTGADGDHLHGEPAANEWDEVLPRS